jgi:hypothetical protein
MELIFLILKILPALIAVIILVGFCAPRKRFEIDETVSKILREKGASDGK